MEAWKPFSSQHSQYEVSSLGRVRSLRQGIKKQHVHPQGYLSVTYHATRTATKRALVHRLVATAFLPNPHNKEFVNHIDGNKQNNGVENLEWVTRRENEAHAVSTGLKNSKGIANTQAKLTEGAVIKIRAMGGLGFRRDVLGDYFGVSGATIGRVVARAIWKHV